MKKSELKAKLKKQIDYNNQLENEIRTLILGEDVLEREMLKLRWKNIFEMQDIFWFGLHNKKQSNGSAEG